jgi:hypothetical protein
LVDSDPLNADRIIEKAKLNKIDDIIKSLEEEDLKLNKIENKLTRKSINESF